MGELVAIFLRFGILGFGGPIATIAMQEKEFVQKRAWLSAEKFNQTLSLIKVLPGATATQLAIYIGKEKYGRWGGVLAGFSFIFPSALLVLILSIFYVKTHTVPQMSALFKGLQIAALAVIADSVYGMGKPYLQIPKAVLIGLFSGVVVFVKPSLEPLVILSLGFIGAMGLGRFLVFSAPGFSLSFLQTPIAKVTLVCLKAGFLVFGTGLAVIPVLEADVVTKYHWLTHAEFLDGLALGQITPGPVSTTATFIGYKVAGMGGALWATIGIFASAFFNILILIPLIEKQLKNSPRLKGFTDWAFPAVIGGIIATSLRLALVTIHSWFLLIWLLGLTFVAIGLRPPAWLFIPASGFGIFIVSRIFLGWL